VPTLEEATSTESGLFVKGVGTIRSIYKLCVGTPRQGLLVPNARGCIELEKIGDASTASSVIGLEDYSHIWVVFVFHLNTKSSNPKRIKSMISPPALGGQKVGLFATRSPHRHNAIGMTLCKIDRIETIKKTKHTKEKVVIHISGLDLVDGTPVLDIKPFVPIYDSVPEVGTVALPAWVEGGLATQRDVVIDQSAREELGAILEQDKDALKFYGPSHGERSTQETVDCTLGCIQQVLAMDVRSNFQTKKAREGKSQAERAKRLQGATGSAAAGVCTQQLDNLLIEYTVRESPNHKRSSSVGSGAEDMVTVSSIKLLEEGS
jgi:tRNA-Thr(GGU) m(6)t(6)A37 methyltransferase TsaA